MDKAIDLLESGTIDFGFLINSVYALENGSDAIQQASQRGVLKVLLKCS